MLTCCIHWIAAFSYIFHPWLFTGYLVPDMHREEGTLYLKWGYPGAGSHQPGTGRVTLCACEEAHSNTIGAATGMLLYYIVCTLTGCTPMYDIETF